MTYLELIQLIHTAHLIQKYHAANWLTIYKAGGSILTVQIG